jgi:hypothetical protein
VRNYQRNFAVSTVAFVLFVVLAATGLVMRFVLPKGSGESLTLWGLGRHGWGGLHFWIAAAMLATIALHLILNWRWIVAVVRGRPREQGIGPRVGAGLAALAVLLGVVATPFLSPVRETGSPPEREMERAGTEARPAPPLVPAGAATVAGAAAVAPRPLGGADTTRCAPAGETASVHGTMSLEEAARAAGVPAEHLIRELRLPADVPRTRPLRELTGAHGFTMDDVRRIVADYLKHCE